jgi:hypothetical protein
MSEIHEFDRTKRAARLGSLAAAMLIFAGVAATAAERGHGAHVHGVGRLNVAAEGATVEIELISPAADIVGFEHPAETAADKAAVAAAVSSLKSGQTQFAFPEDAGCRLETADVDAPSAAGHGDEHGKHGHTADDHDDKTHADIRASYRFRCSRPERLLHIDVKLFQHFPRIGELEVQTISPRGQSAQELKPAAARLKL